MPAQQAPQRLQPPAGPAHPVAQRGAVELDPLPGEDRCLAIERQEIGVLGHQHMRQQGLGGHPAGDRPLRCWGLHHRLLAGPAAVAGRRITFTRSWAGTMSSISLVSSPITCKAPPQQGQLLSSTSTSTSTRGRCAGKAPRLRRRTRGVRGVLFLAATSSCAASAAAAVCSRSSRPSCSWSGSRRSERRPNCPRCSCRIRSRSFSISACAASCSSRMRSRSVRAASRSARTVSRSISRAVILRALVGNDFSHLLQLL